MPNNIILIGMPGSGKSTLGVQLANALQLSFIDSDTMIEEQQHCSLQSIVDTKGYLALRKIEEQALLQLTLDNQLFATGGSAVYSEQAMRHLKQQGQVVYLSTPFDTLRERINNENQRGIARPKHHTLSDVYLERTPLYERYADVTINNTGQIDIQAVIANLELK